MKKSGVALLALTISMGYSSVYAESLSDIYELALENDAQLKAEEAQYRANLETEKLGLAGLLPQINATYDYTDSDQDTQGESFDIGATGGTIVDTLTNVDTDRKGYQVSLRQPLFDLPAWFTFQSGKQFSKQAEAIFLASQQNLIVRVVEAYLLVLRGQDNLEASKAQERAFERQLEQTQQRFEVGLIAITDVYEAQAAYDLSQVNRIVDENNVSVALERLSVLTGRSHDNLSVLKEDFDIKLPEPLDRAAWVEFALENNFNLKAQRYAEEAARQGSKARTMGHAPVVSGSYTYSDYETEGDLTRSPATDFDGSPNQDLEANSWQIRVDIPLFSGGAVSSNRRRAAQDGHQRAFFSHDCGE
jgi:outer membrane protein